MVSLKVSMALAVGFAAAVALSGCAVPAVDIGLSNSTFDFGPTLVSRKAIRDVVTLTNTGADSATLNLQLTGDSSLAVETALSCGATVPSGGTCSIAVSYLPAKTGDISGTLNLTLTDSIHTVSKTVALQGSGVQVSPGSSTVVATGNPVVALYNMQPIGSGTVTVEFGTDTSYGQKTGAFATPADGGPMSILVAGMRQGTTYHMRAITTATDGTVTADSDHTFTTGSFPSDILPELTVTTTNGMTPQPGIELVNAASSSVNSDYLQAFATDLQGRILWGYNFADRPTANTIIQPIKLMPNGDFMMAISFPSQYLLPGQGVTLTDADRSVDLIREIDLAGDPVRQLTLDQLNQKLASAGYNLTALDIHHDIALLPNGHIVLIAALQKSFPTLAGEIGATTVQGDMLIDLDQDFNVAWVWNEFDHLDVNRHPMSFPDWTHTNAVLYSATDGNLVVSIRHQSWILKIDYENGTGNGNILWTLGNDGDFRLVNGTAPQDWFYAQHEPAFVNSTTAGQFSISMMDNGDNRILANGATCGDTANPCYTTAPVLALDELAKTATITFRQTLPSSKYSEWGGNATVLANGNLEYDLCASPQGIATEVDEITMGSSPQVVWSMADPHEDFYRAHRLPSLYPGVQW